MFGYKISAGGCKESGDKVEVFVSQGIVRMLYETTQ